MQNTNTKTVTTKEAMSLMQDAIRHFLDAFSQHASPDHYDASLTILEELQNIAKFIDFKSYSPAERENLDESIVDSCRIAAITSLQQEHYSHHPVSTNAGNHLHRRLLDLRYALAEFMAALEPPFSFDHLDFLQEMISKLSYIHKEYIDYQSESDIVTKRKRSIFLQDEIAQLHTQLHTTEGRMPSTDQAKGDAAIPGFEERLAIVEATDLKVPLSNIFYDPIRDYYTKECPDVPEKPDEKIRFDLEQLLSTFVFESDTPQLAGVSCTFIELEVEADAELQKNPKDEYYKNLLHDIKESYWSVSDYVHPRVLERKEQRKKDPQQPQVRPKFSRSKPILPASWNIVHPDDDDPTPTRSL